MIIKLFGDVTRDIVVLNYRQDLPEVKKRMIRSNGQTDSIRNFQYLNIRIYTYYGAGDEEKPYFINWIVRFYSHVVCFRGL